MFEEGGRASLDEDEADPVLFFSPILEKNPLTLPPVLSFSVTGLDVSTTSLSDVVSDLPSSDLEEGLCRPRMEDRDLLSLEDLAVKDGGDGRRLFIEEGDGKALGV